MTLDTLVGLISAGGIVAFLLGAFIWGRRRRDADQRIYASRGPALRAESEVRGRMWVEVGDSRIDEAFRRRVELREDGLYVVGQGEPWIPPIAQFAFGDGPPGLGASRRFRVSDATVEDGALQLRADTDDHRVRVVLHVTEPYTWLEALF